MPFSRTGAKELIKSSSQQTFIKGRSQISQIGGNVSLHTEGNEDASSVSIKPFSRKPRNSPKAGLNSRLSNETSIAQEKSQNTQHQQSVTDSMISKGNTSFTSSNSAAKFVRKCTSNNRKVGTAISTAKVGSKLEGDQQFRRNNTSIMSSSPVTTPTTPTPSRHLKKTQNFQQTKNENISILVSQPKKTQPSQKYTSEVTSSDISSTGLTKPQYHHNPYSQKRRNQPSIIITGGGGFESLNIDQVVADSIDETVDDCENKRYFKSRITANNRQRQGTGVFGNGNRVEAPIVSILDNKDGKGYAESLQISLENSPPHSGGSKSPPLESLSSSPTSKVQASGIKKAPFHNNLRDKKTQAEQSKKPQPQPLKASSPSSNNGLQVQPQPHKKKRSFSFSLIDDQEVGEIKKQQMSSRQNKNSPHNQQLQTQSQQYQSKQTTLTRSMIQKNISPKAACTGTIIGGTAGGSSSRSITSTSNNHKSGRIPPSTSNKRVTQSQLFSQKNSFSHSYSRQKLKLQTSSNNRVSTHGNDDSQNNNILDYEDIDDYDYDDEYDQVPQSYRPRPQQQQKVIVRKSNLLQNIDSTPSSSSSSSQTNHQNSNVLNQSIDKKSIGVRSGLNKHNKSSFSTGSLLNMSNASQKKSNKITDMILSKFEKKDSPVKKQNNISQHQDKGQNVERGGLKKKGKFAQPSTSQTPRGSAPRSLGVSMSVGSGLGLKKLGVSINDIGGKDSDEEIDSKFSKDIDNSDGKLTVNSQRSITSRIELRKVQEKYQELEKKILQQERETNAFKKSNNELKEQLNRLKRKIQTVTKEKQEDAAQFARDLQEKQEKLKQALSNARPNRQMNQNSSMLSINDVRSSHRRPSIAESITSTNKELHTFQQIAAIKNQAAESYSININTVNKQNCSNCRQKSQAHQQQISFLEMKIMKKEDEIKKMKIQLASEKLKHQEEIQSKNKDIQQGIKKLQDFNIEKQQKQAQMNANINQLKEQIAQLQENNRYMKIQNSVLMKIKNQNLNLKIDITKIEDERDYFKMRTLEVHNKNMGKTRDGANGSGNANSKESFKKLMTSPTSGSTASFVASLPLKKFCSQTEETGESDSMQGNFKNNSKGKLSKCSTNRDWTYGRTALKQEEQEDSQQHPVSSELLPSHNDNPNNISFKKTLTTGSDQIFTLTSEDSNENSDERRKQFFKN